MKPAAQPQSLSQADLNRVAASAAEAAIRGCRIEIAADLARVADAAAAAALRRYRTELGKERRFISKSEAYRRHGRRLVDRWLREGLIALHKDTNKNHACRLDAEELEKAANTSNYASYFNSIN
jgi:hypothetical protein